jgi:hypothetical protein
VSTDPFLVIAETRADHLRQLGQHERALEWVTASLSEVESEIPELELAMAVFQRLNPETADQEGDGQPAFLGIAGERADHLRQLSSNMRSLDWLTAPLSDVEAEVLDLETAMSVYRRLVPEEAGAVAGVGAVGHSGTSRGADEIADPPSFREYALQHLDSVAVETGEEGDGNPPNGANANL